MVSERGVFLTGAWLGAVQASLGYAMLIGVGASALVYFVLLAAWIVAGALAATYGRRDFPLFVAALLVLAATRVLSATMPFATVTMIVAFLACFVCGGYAGFFIGRVGSGANDRRRFLLFENNGFVTGFAVASLLLFVSAHALDAIVFTGGAALFATKVRAR